MANEKLTPTEQRMLRLLQDGHPHRPDELQTCLWDEKGAVINVRVHLVNLRKKIRVAGQDVMGLKVDGVFYYRLVRLTTSHARYAPLEDES